jgi:hypothetical protein
MILSPKFLSNFDYIKIVDRSIKLQDSTVQYKTTADSTTKHRT